MFAGAAFTDQADIESTDAVDTLVALGVIQGYTDGSFRPETTVTRAEMAKMIYTILNGGNDDASAYENLPTSFTDLTEDWYKGYVKYLQNSDIIAGTSATTFAPNETVTGVEAAKMMLVAAGYSPDKAGLTGLSWRVNTMKYANANSLFAGVNCDINSGLPRQYAAQILYNSLDMENVVYSKDIDGFKPATDVSEQATIGAKYMDLITYEGVLLGSGEYGSNAGKDKLGIDYSKKNGKSVDPSVTKTFDYATDVTDLVGQYVKVQTGKNDKVYGVFAVASENTVVTDTFAKVEVTVEPTAPTQGNAGTDGKVEIDGTEYKLAADFTINGVTISDLGNIDKVRSGDQITFVSNDGDSKFDAAYVNPMTNFGEVLYVGADSITVAGESDSLDKDDITYPEDLAEGDYVAVYADLYTGNDVLVKADKVAGEIEMTKDNDVRLDGTWYTLGDESAALWTGMETATIEGTPKAGDDYTLYVINGVVYNAELDTAGSTDTALVIAAPGSMTVNGNYQVKLLFADNSQTVVEADKAYNAAGKGGDLIGKLVTYEKDSEDVYELTEVDGDNLAGGDSYDSDASNASFDESTTRVKIGSNDYRVSSTATVYIQYEDDGDILYRAMTGADLNKLGDDFTAEAGGAVVVKDGLASVVMLKSSTNYLPGAGSDKVYGYVTEIIGTSKDYTELNVWTSDNEALEGVRVRGTAPAKGDLISFNLSSDNYLEGVKQESSLSVVEGAIKDFSMGEYVTFYKANSGTISDYNLTDDTEYIYLDTNNTAGVSGSKLAAAQKDTNGDYYINAKYILDGNDIVMIACDITSRRWYEANGTDAGKVDTDLLPATAPTVLNVTAADANQVTVTGSTIDMLTAKTGTVTGFVDTSADCVKLNATLGASTTATYAVQTTDDSDYGSAQSLTDAGITSIDLGSKAGTAKIKVTVSQADHTDVVYELVITVEA